MFKFKERMSLFLMNKTEISQFLTNTTVEQQENLSKESLNSLFRVPQDKRSPGDLDFESSRPRESFLELMKWTEENFKKHLKDTSNINRFVHNRVIIDGQFIAFAKEKKVKITCLYKDAIISWKTDNNFEKYFVQGVFKIEYKNCEFIHAALYHKGNQHEDEVSFFVLCSNSNYDSYVEIRNEFDDWVQQRDRSNLHIRVIDGDDIPYTKDHSWNDLFFPEDLKTELKSVVEGFLSSKDFYLSKKIPWKRGILLYGKPGNGKTSLIRTLISVYNFKPVTITSNANDDTVREAFSYSENQSPALLYFEDLDSLFQKVDLSSFLNLMDGVASKNGLFIVATANEIKKLKSSITDRPSRFDRKFEIPLPNQKMAYIYLKKWFGKLLPDAEYKRLSIVSVKYGFSYVHLKELYISSMYEVISNNRKAPTKADVNKVLQCLIKDKNILGSDKTVDTEKYLT
jgi:hypothetical protein